MLDTICNTFVLVATDCPVSVGLAPTPKGTKPTVALLQYDLLIARPYILTLKELIFETHIRHADLPKAEAASKAADIRELLFAKSHPCMRASPLPKRYGWGVHYDHRGRLALHAMESPEYRKFASGQVQGVTLTPAMRSKRAE